MAVFTMCTACEREYSDPAERRFHTQPNACPECGPRVWIEGPDGARVCSEQDVDAVDSAARLIREGQVVRIRFDDYPYKEYGVATGAVQAVSVGIALASSGATATK